MRNKNSLEKINSNGSNNELILNGRPVSRGVGIGRTLCLHGNKRQFYRVKLDDNKIEKEIRRFRASVRLAKRQINKISKNKELVNHNHTAIFQTHLIFLEDKTLLKKIEEQIGNEKVNAEWAVKTITDKYIADYKTISDIHLREKYIDLEDVSERLLIALGGGRKPGVKFEDNSVIIAKELNPSTLIEFSENKPAAIVTENGGWTSHTFILARELNLPAVTGLKGILRRIETGEEIVVDGFNGRVFIKPKKETIKKFKSKENQIQAKIQLKKLVPVKNNLKTLDGIGIKIRANLDLPKAYKESKKIGAKGIGLYRSEYLFNQNKGFPSEKEQVESYQNIAQLVGKDGVIIRTFDLNIHQFADENAEKEKNPALGLRAIRWGLKNEKEFRTQLRALLTAAYQNHIDIVLPMISDVAEIIRVKQIIQQEKNKLCRKNIKFGEPKLGAMIEIPSAVILIEEIIREVDFLNLGTNDLVQYMLAVDRDNEEVSDWFRTLHPAVIKSIKKVSQAANKAEKPLIVCGEMAGTPIYVAILIGLGVTDLSMNLNSIPRVRSVISNIAYEEAKTFVDELQNCRTSDELEKFVRDNFMKHWKHLFDENTLPAKRKNFYKS
ncbi:MAG: phosphoenolpyruvate--protein phosphotransferase [Aridibacter sp.]